MRYYKNLNIRGAILDKNELGKYLEKVAENHNVLTKSRRKTYPIPDMKENYKFILETYKLLNAHLKKGITIHSAGEWILDNFYLIEETVKNIEKELNIKRYINLNGIGDSKNSGYARIYEVASEVIGYTDSKINADLLKHAIDCYQSKKLLTSEELLTLPVFLKISLIENIAECCEKIYISQIQKYKVEDICRRIIDNNEDGVFKSKKFKIKVKNKFDYSDLKNSFVEYMSYKLKQKGSIGTAYLEALEEQVKYTGTSVEEIIIKEHFHIATIKNSLGNSITSIKDINRINFKELFESSNKVNNILSLDPAGVFEKMDQDTKDMYLREITSISKRYKLSELFIANKLVEISLRHRESLNEKRKHVGYYLIDEGREEFLSTVLGKKVDKLTEKQKSIIFVRSTFYIPMIMAFFTVSFININWYLKPIFFLLFILLFMDIYIKTIMYIISKFKKPKIIPKMNLYNRLDENKSSFVVIPSIIGNKEKIDELVKKLEIYYLANKTPNLYFSILGDCTTLAKEIGENDAEIIKYGRKRIYDLNKKYQKDILNNNGNKIFYFLYRKRRWNPSEGAFLGWERKRGLLNQFNDYLLNGDMNDFVVNTINECGLKAKIKYIITLDSDTNLILNSSFKMIGAMEHILNKPIIANGRVVSGYGIMQPKVGIGLKDSMKSLFSKIYSSNPGMNMYSSASYDFYQDVFKEAIFTGKGIYNLDVYSEVMNGKIDENTVLSHDLLESNYLRCAFLSDVVILDSYPYKIASYINREHRWIRGDWQLIKWISKKEKTINLISKFKIYDNLRRSIVGIVQIIIFFMALIINSPIIMVINLFSIFLTIFFDLVDQILFRKTGKISIINARKNFDIDYSGISGDLVKTGLDFVFLPSIAYMSINAIVKTIYRLRVKKRLLEWVTSEDAEKAQDNSIENYYTIMWPNLILGIITFGFLNPFAEICATIWILGPFIAGNISRQMEMKSTNLKKEDLLYLLEIGKKTWKYFEENMDEATGYLPPDNYQESRKNKIVMRTSSTNIGLGLLSVISACDLNYIDEEKAVFYIEKIIDTVDKLEKWNGHLYNWYNLKDFNPLHPRYISTVDSGNFVGYLYVTKEFLEEKRHAKNNDKRCQQIERIIYKIETIINSTDFSVLYNNENKLFSIGFDIEKMRLTDSYYDFLASEARQASYIAIARKDVSEKHWWGLSRTLTTLNGYKGLISWSGTAFEYLMPTINMNSYIGSTLDESCKFMIMAQMKYSRKLGIPWGISEAAYSIKDLSGNYQYKAFGIPFLGLKRGLEEEAVVSPYSTFLALKFVGEKAVNNLKELENYNMFGEYGFFESIDFTKSRLKENQDYIVVKTYMAHHQGLILASINNFINEDVLNKRFSINPEIASADVLLQEKMPNSVMISKNKNEVLKKNKYVNEYYDKNVVYSRQDLNGYRRFNVLSNDYYQIVTDIYGRECSSYKGILINREYDNVKNNNLNEFFIKNISNGKIYRTSEIGHYKDSEIVFNVHSSEYNVIKDKIGFEYRITPLSSGRGEIRRLSLENYDISDKNLEITSASEIVLSSITQDIAHPIFNNMFLKFEYIESEDLFIIQRRDRNIENDKYYLGVKMYIYPDDVQLSKTRFEIDKALFTGRKNIGIPELVLNNSDFSNRIKDVVEPILSLNKPLKLSSASNSKVLIDLIVNISDSRESLILEMQKYNSIEKRNNEFVLSKSKAEEEIKYLKLNGDKIETYQRIYGHLIANDISKNEEVLKRVYESGHIYNINDLWKYGISGDKKILCVKLKNIDDIDLVKDILKCFEYYQLRKVDIDLCFINAEEFSYNMFLRDYIINEVREVQLEYLINERIFIIDECRISKEDHDLFYVKSNLFIDAKYSSLKVNLDEMEKQKKEDIEEYFVYKRPKILFENSKNYSDTINDNLLFFNGIGGFSSDGQEYIFRSSKDNEVPLPWSNVLAGDNFGTIITDNFGGFTWYKNSRLKRINNWNNDSSIDSPSELMYIKDVKENKYFSVCTRCANDMNYVIKHGHGYSSFIQVADNLLQNIDVFVEHDKNQKNIFFNLKNLAYEKRYLKLYYYIDLVLGEDKEKTNGNIICKKGENSVQIKNIFSNQFDKEIVISCNLEIKNVIYGKRNFFGEEYDLRAPKYILNKSLEEQKKYSKANGIALEIDIKLQEFENKEIVFSIGEDRPKEELSKYYNSLNEVKTFWNNNLSKLHINTPDERLNIFINSWCVYQILSSRIYAKSAYYQSGGAIRSKRPDSRHFWFEIFRSKVYEKIYLKTCKPSV